MTGFGQGVHLELSRDGTLPKWLRRWIRRNQKKYGVRIRFSHRNFGRRGKAFCVSIPGAEAQLLLGGGGIALKVPGEEVFRNGLYFSDVLSVRDFAGQMMTVNILWCHDCMAPSGLHLPGEPTIVCTGCGNEWDRREMAPPVLYVVEEDFILEAIAS